MSCGRNNSRLRLTFENRLTFERGGLDNKQASYSTVIKKRHYPILSYHARF